MVAFAIAHLSGTGRSQLLLLPEAVDDYVGPDNPVRFIEAFVDGLDLVAAGFVRVAAKETGRPGYDPADLLKLCETLGAVLHRIEVLENGPDNMSELIIWTYDWVPQGPRGFVRDLRLRWACEEAGLGYSVRTVPFDGRETNHRSRQPFGQVPFLSDGELEIFESGAGLLHLARKNEKLMPRDPVGEAETVQWMIAALNSIEMVTVPWWFLEVSGAEDNGLADWMGNRLNQLEKVLNERDWLAADRFTAADLLMADVLRIPQVRSSGDRPATAAYVTRVTDRPSFKKARADQLAHFAAADESRSAAG